jgi:hypothetical protein
VTPRLALLGTALALAAAVGLVSARRAADQLAVIEACDAAAAGDAAAALARTSGRTGGDETGRSAAECRCTALLALGRGTECADLLEEIAADPRSEDWAPRPELAVHLVQTRREDGRLERAAELARRFARVHAEDPDLFYLELVTRSALEDEATVLRELSARVPARGPGAVRMRVSLANRWLLRGDLAGALAALGEDPPPGAGERTGLWFETLGMAHAAAGDLAGLERTYARWRAAGGDPRELSAREALTLSIGKLRDPREPTLERLRRELEQGVEDPQLAEALTVRLVIELVNAGRFDEARAAYARGRERFAMPGLSLAEIERAAAIARIERSGGELPSGRIAFAVPEAGRGGHLLVSPDADAPVDAAWEALPVPASGRVEVTRRAGEAPARWVLRDAAGAVVASGAVEPVPGGNVSVEVAARAPSEPHTAALARGPADGRRRVALLLLDCGDWRIAQYLRARGELPVLDALLAGGWRAVLDSDPPLTAAALEALVWPGREPEPSFVGLVHRFGVELAGLSSIGDNPFDALAWLLPEQTDLFEAAGAGERVAANLLFAHGGLRAGRHGELTGPRGARRRVELGASARDLDAAERERFPGLAAASPERDAVHVRTIAAELDAAVDLVTAGEIDLLMLRVEPLDLLTHALFAEAVRPGQDDGRGLLFEVYRYLDARIGEVSRALDGDDVLIVMSDHGIRTAMEHSRDAMFVAHGGGIAPGRAPGRPSLRGVPRALADLLALDTDWPELGVLGGGRAWSRAPAGAPSDS